MVREYGYEYDAPLLEPLFAQTKGIVTNQTLMGATCLRSGRDALKAIAREFSPTLVLLPALSCDSMSVPFKLYHHTIQYYRMKEDYTVDIENVRSLITDKTGSVLFLYMDYFGNNAITDKDLQQLKCGCKNLVFIEDRTHNLLIEKKRAFTADYSMASLRKWLAVPDGGLLWTNRALTRNDFGEDTTFSETRLSAQRMRNQFLNNGNPELKKEFRHIFGTVTDMIDIDPLPARMSAYSYKIASEADFALIQEKRERNAKALIQELRTLPVSFVRDSAGTGDVYVAILTNKRDELQQKLSKLGIFCTIIWPLSVEQKSICPVAKYTEEHMLAIYCDQRYTPDDMKFIASSIKRVYYE